MTHGDELSNGETEQADGSTLTRRDALGLLGGTAVAAVAGDAAASHGTGETSSPETWQNDRDAQGHDLLDAATVEASSVTMEELDADSLGETDSLGIDDADLAHVHTGARAADRVVWKDESGTFHADGPDGQVASGADLLTVTQAAVDSLTADRTWKESVLVTASGTISASDSSRSIDLPSYTVFDVPGTIRYEGGEGFPVRAQEVNHIEVPRLHVTGDPSSAVLIRQNCTDVRLGHLDLRFDPDGGTGVGIRIDDGTSPVQATNYQEYDDVTVGSVSDRGAGTRCKDVRIGSAYIEHANSHAIETFGILRCQVGEVLAKHQGGCALLFNSTFDSTVGSVAGYNPESTSSYATFRAANYCENLTVGQVVSRDAPRGVHVIGGSRDVTIGEVAITGSRDRGIKIDRIGVENVEVQGGYVRNCTPTGVVSQGDDVSISNLRVVDDRPEHERTQANGILLTTVARNNRVANNDVRRAGTEANIQIEAPAEDVRPTSIVRDNVGDGIASGTVVLQSGATPAARVEGVTGRKDVTLDLRASTVRGPADGKPFAWDGYFEWNGDTDQWDLVFEWETDPLENVEVEYIVDQPLANVGPSL